MLDRVAPLLCSRDEYRVSTAERAPGFQLATSYTCTRYENIYYQHGNSVTIRQCILFIAPTREDKTSTTRRLTPRLGLGLHHMLSSCTRLRFHVSPPCTPLSLPHLRLRDLPTKHSPVSARPQQSTRHNHTEYSPADGGRRIRSSSKSR